jgi:hypothetical protein
MIRSKKLLLAMAIFCACGVIARADEKQWNPATTYTIPNDGDTYYVDFTKTLTTNLDNNGTLEIRNGGAIVTGLPLPNKYINNQGTITVKTGGSISGTGNIYSGMGGFDGTINVEGGSITGPYIYNAYNTSRTGTINLSSGTIAISNTLNNGHGPGCNGIINISGGSLQVGSGATLSNANGSSSPASINITGGLLEVSGGALNNGNGTSASITVSDGTIKISSGTIVNGYGSGKTGNLTITGGAFELAGGTFTNGWAATRIGNLTLSHPAQFVLGGGSLVDGTGTSNISIYGNHFNVSSGTLTNDGTFTLPSKSIFSINSNGTFINNATLDVNEEAKLNIQGDLKNKSSSSVNIYGNVYTYSYIENGDAGNAGTININYPGNLYLLSALLKNAHASSAININSGGTLNNYQGTVDVALGSLNLNNGGKFNNIRGNYPSTLTPANGGNFFDGNVMFLDQDLDIDYTWTITEKAKIFGDGNKITFGTNGAIVVEGADVSLLLEDVQLENVSGNKIRCTENTTTLSIDNVIWTQDANYSFTKGTLNVNGDWLVKGANTVFTYNTNQTSTLQQDTNLIFDKDVTFSYGSSSANNIVLIDATAKIHFNGAILYVTQDARFKDGTFAFENIVTFSTETGKSRLP